MQDTSRRGVGFQSRSALFRFGCDYVDGVKVAADKIGKGAERFAMHVGGQELPMHDPRRTPGYGATYIVDPTPGSHTAGGSADSELGVVSRIIKKDWLIQFSFTLFLLVLQSRFKMGY